MVVLTMLRLGEFDKPFAYFREEVAYVGRLHSLIRAGEAKQISNIANFTALKCLLLGHTLHSVHFLRRRELFDCDNNLCMRVCQKGVLYVAGPNVFLYFEISTPHDVRNSSCC